MTMDQLAKRAVVQLAAVNPGGAAETMRELLERGDLLAEEITALRNDLEIESAARERWRLRCMAADDEASALRSEICDLRRHLLTLHTELQRFEERV